MITRDLNPHHQACHLLHHLGVIIVTDLDHCLVAATATVAIIIVVVIIQAVAKRMKPMKLRARLLHLP
jgi:hypothetical protein